MPDIINNFDISYHVLTIDIKHKSIVIRESERIINILCCV